MVTVGLNEEVVTEALVCNNVPPEEASYQRKVPEVAEVAVNETDPDPQR